MRGVVLINWLYIVLACVKLLVAAKNVLLSIQTFLLLRANGPELTCGVPQFELPTARDSDLLSRRVGNITNSFLPLRGEKPLPL